MSGLLKKVAENSKVWVVWPHGSSQKKIETIIKICLLKRLRVDLITDYKPDSIPVQDLLGVKASSVYEWLNTADDIAVVKAACNLADHWFDSPPINSTLEWLGIKLGEMLGRNLPSQFLIDTIRQVEGVLGWLGRERPSIVVFPDFRESISIAFQQVMRREDISIIFASGRVFQEYLASLIKEFKFQVLVRFLDVRDIVLRVVLAKLMHWRTQLRRRKLSKNGDLALFIGFTPNHYSHILPIAQSLRQKHWQVNILRGLVGTTLYASQGINLLPPVRDTVDGYITTGAYTRYRKGRQLILGLWRQFDHNNTLRALFIYRDVDIWPLIKQHMRYCFYMYLPTAIRYIEITLSIIDKEFPRLLVFGNDSCFRGRAMVAAARQRNIPTLVVQHGLAAAPWDYVPYSDKMIVWSKSNRNVIVKWGAIQENLFCTGAVGFDSLVLLSTDQQRLNHRRKLACKKLKIKNTSDYVLLLTSPLDDNTQELIIRMAFQAGKDLSLEDRFIIKLHPEDTGKLYKKIALEKKFQPLIVKNADLWGVIAASKLVITTLNSTTGIEALILKKPVIAVKTTECHSIYNNTSGLIYQVESKEDLKARLRELLSKDFKPDVTSLEWLVGPLDGKATARAMHQISSMNKTIHL